MSPCVLRSIWLNVFVLLAAAVAEGTQGASPTVPPSPSPSPPPLPSLRIARAAGAIAVDGVLDDAGWASAPKVETWFETNPGDNVTPPVGNVGYLAYDDRFLYAAFEFLDPEPTRIKAPLADRDNVGSDTDYGGVILDTRADGKTGILLLANPRGVQYDSVSDDTSGNEDSAPDFFWDSAARINEKGWVLELRIPFSSLRYPKSDVQSWNIMLYRNYPRAYRYQMFSSRLPRGGNCFICHSRKMEGLQGLPRGGSVVLAPYVSANRSSVAVDGAGSRLDAGNEGDVGLDAKWTPGANVAIDATLNPDFSQIESDVAQIGANERFALSFPEKRPFFLEGAELLRTPIQAVYTRSITAPRFGLRTTGKLGKTAYTGLFAQDRGGGQVILPGPLGSESVPQDFRSWVSVGRLRRDIGKSFVSVLGSSREVSGGGYNRLVGPDFQWRPTSGSTVTGQYLYSWTRNPSRTDLAESWDGRRTTGHGATLWATYNTPKYDAYAQLLDFSDGFRADNGFVTQVGFRETFGEVGRTFRPQGFLRRVRAFFFATRQEDKKGDLLLQFFSFGAGMDGRFSSFGRFRYARDEVRSGDVILTRGRIFYDVEANPTRWLSQVSVGGFAGQQIDFTNHRVGTGASVAVRATVRPTDHLELRLLEDLRWLNVDRPGAVGQGRERLFTARVDRVRATYTFTSRLFVRGIAQYVETERDPTLYTDTVERRTAGLSASALFAYKLNWQTVMFVGYGDNRELDDADALAPTDRQVFFKLSYAFQR
jgi:hypothetical protein